MERQRIAEVHGGDWVAQNQRLDYHGVMDLVRADYRFNGRRSLDRVERAGKHLEPVFGHLKAHHITADKIDGYATMRLDEGAAPATVRVELAALKRGLRLAVKKRMLTAAPPFPTLQVNNARQVFIEDAELDALLPELPEYIGRLFLFAYLTGWRTKSEVLGVGTQKTPLLWSDVNWATGMVSKRIGTTKNNDGRTYPFGNDPRLVELLEQQQAYTKTWEKKLGAVIPWVFHRNGVQMKEAPYAAWRSACLRAGVVGPDGEPKRFHDCRRSQVRNLDRAGVSRDVAKRLVGHKTDSMYSRYNIVIEDDLRDGVAKLATSKTEQQGTPVTPLLQAGGAR